MNLWGWWLAGGIIGLLIPAMYYLARVAFGVSTGYGSIIALICPRTRVSWFRSEQFSDRWGWRLFFMAGIVIGGFLSGRLGGLPVATLALGQLTAVGRGFAVDALWLLTGGTLLGLGARMAGGCPSGHSIHGLATGQLSSLVATVMFLAMGVVTMNVVSRVVLGW